MLSKGGKIEYSCSSCNSPNIMQHKQNVVLMTSKSGWKLLHKGTYSCLTCGHTERWHLRNKRSLNKC